MTLDLSRTLVVGISSTALFDLKKADRMFRELREEDPDKAIERYRDYIAEAGGRATFSFAERGHGGHRRRD